MTTNLTRKKLSTQYFLDPYHGNTLQGPQINKLFSHLEELRRIVKAESETLTDFIDTIEKLKEVDNICNNAALNQELTVIQEFKVSWIKLKGRFGISVPNKLHIITDHLSVYLTKTIESTHQEFSKRMEAGNYNVKNFRSKVHGKMLRGVIHFNSFNFGYGV